MSRPELVDQHENNTQTWLIAAILLATEVIASEIENQGTK